MNNTLDTRDLQKRLEKLQSLKEGVETAQSNVDELMVSDLAVVQPDFDEHMINVKDILSDAKDDFGGAEKELEELEFLSNEISEWNNGTQLIPEADFEDYCREFCKDIGDIPEDLPSYIVIDWEATARNIRMDYSECEYLGRTYLYR